MGGHSRKAGPANAALGRRVRMAVLITGFTAGGAQKQCAYLLNAMAATSRFEILVLYYLDGPNRTLLAPDIRVQQLSVRSLYTAEAVRQAHVRFRAFKPDILFTWLHAADVYGFVLKLFNPGWRWVMTERDSAYPLEWRYLLRRVAGCFSDLIIANSDSGVQYWKTRLLQPRVAKANNIVPSSPVGRKQIATIRRIAFIGRLEPQKNVEVVCQAFIALATRCPSLEFIIVGAGSLEASLTRMIRESPSAARVRMFGYRDDVLDLLRSIDLVVSVSHHEGTPNVILEAVRAGAGVVASRIPEHEAVLGKSFPLLVSDRHDWQAVVNGIEAAIASPARAQSEHAIALIDEMSPDAVRREYEDLFETCLLS